MERELSDHIVSERLGSRSLAERSRAGLRWGKVFRERNRAVASGPVTNAARGNRVALCVDTLYILGGFGVILGAIALLGALGFGFGFNVFPFWEDITWVDILLRGKGTEAARLWWANDNRNPLSPWWYIGARSIILNFEPGLLALRYAVSALLALSAYCLVLTVAGPRSRSFALAFAILTGFWMSNRYVNQILWVQQGALAFSLLSIAAYAQFVRGGRSNYHLYAASLVAWSIAFTTYTIQCGAMLAIAYLALRRTLEHSSSGEKLSAEVARMAADSAETKRAVTETAADPVSLRSAVIVPIGGKHRIARGLLTAAADTVPYAALLGLFLLIWETTMHPGLVGALSLHFTLAGFFASLREGVWHSDFSLFYSRLAGSPDLLAIVLAAAACSLIAFCALLLRRRWPGMGAAVIQLPQLVDVLVVLACVAGPTIVLESSSSIWAPGTRWPMLYQVTTPALLLGLVTLFLIMTTRPSVQRYRFWIAAVSVAIGVGAAFSLAQSQEQVEITKNEKFVREGLLRLVAEEFVAGRKPPLQVLIMLDEIHRSRWSADTLSPAIARVWLQRDDISFRLVNWFAAPSSDWASWWRIRFGPDSEGVGNAKVWGESVPYDRLRILEIKGHAARRISVADQDVFNGLEVEWQRTGAITLPEAGGVFCPITWSADHEVLGTGMDVTERDDKGPFRWTTSRAARLILPSDCRQRSLLRVVVARALSQGNIDNLVLFANGQKLQYRRTLVEGDVVYEAELPAEIVAQKSLIEIDLAVTALDRIPNRQVGIAIRRVEVHPTAPAS